MASMKLMALAFTSPCPALPQTRILRGLIDTGPVRKGSIPTCQEGFNLIPFLLDSKSAMTQHENPKVPDTREKVGLY